MSSNQRKRSGQYIRKRKSRGRLYLILGLLILILAIGVGVYVYETSLSANLPDFTINAPAGVTIRTGTPTTSTITIAATNQFKGTVLLSVEAPAGVTATVSPANITKAGTATLTMTATTPGNYTVTVTGTSGTLKHAITPRVATPVYATFSVSNGTINGTIEVELYQAQTPKTVHNFVSLAQSGFYSNLVWHRIVKSPNVIQTGDPNTVNGTGDRSTWGQGGSSQTVPLEIDSSLHNSRSYLGMARSQDVNSGSSQFYINLGDNNYLDGQYTVFGKVIGTGMSFADLIGNHQVDSPANGQPLDPLPLLVSVSISYAP